MSFDMKKGWVLVGKVWVDPYHPAIYKPRDHSKHSKKPSRKTKL